MVLQREWKWPQFLEAQAWNWHHSTFTGVLLAKASHKVQAGSGVGKLALSLGGSCCGVPFAKGVGSGRRRFEATWQATLGTQANQF